MSKKANPTIIGAFVLGAIALIVAAISIFGSGKLFQRHVEAVAFFQGSIQGLTVGSAVNLRGVQIGSVRRIELQIDLQTMEPVIPVYMDFDLDRFKPYGGGPVPADLGSGQRLKAAIEKGLHARLATQSFVTGQLLVDLDLDPTERTQTFGFDKKIIEIPTAQSDIEKLKTTLTQLPIER
jgi:paraquat-inducible protein B